MKTPNFSSTDRIVSPENLFKLEDYFNMSENKESLQNKCCDKDT